MPPPRNVWGCLSASSRAAVLPPHTSASPLSLPPSLLWGGDILLAVPSVLYRPIRPPMSIPLAAPAAVSPAAPWGGDTPLALPRVLSHRGFFPEVLLMLLLPVTTPLGPVTVGDSVTVFCMGRRVRPKCGVAIAIHV